MSSLTRPVKTYVADGENHSLFGLVLAVAFIFTLWQIAGLSQLKPINRWIAVAYCLVWTVIIAWNFFTVPRQLSSRGMVFLFLVVAFNLLSAWYLSRQSFREFSVQFVAERKRDKQSNAEEKQSRAMRNISEKKLRDDIQNYRE